MVNYSIKEMKRKLKYYQKIHMIDKQQYKTLLGITRTGDVIGAEKGLERIMGRVKA